MRKKAEHGIIVLASFFSLVFIVIIGNYFRIAGNTSYSEIAEKRYAMTVEVSSNEGNIYDRNMKRLVNTDTKYVAVAIPQAVERDELVEYAVDKDDFYAKYDVGEPFEFEAKCYIEESDGLTVFRVPIRYSESSIATHIIGYTSQNVGVTGIEYAYDSILRDDYGENSVTYSADGFGRVLIGGGKKVVKSSITCSGVVTTIDSDIQKICENAGSSIEKGAIVVTEIETGNILALASFPDYSLSNIESAVNDENSPMINRALYSYGVGSIFKLVTACEAIQEGYGDLMYNCSGEINVFGQRFRCHKLDGHGLQTMSEAMINSCNTYFINLIGNLDITKLRDTAFRLGFGRETHLCSGITASGGVLPTISSLTVPAELANFSFGQGKLTATPLQISQLTCAIANDGKMPVLRLIRGITEDGITVPNEKNTQYAYAMEESTAKLLKDMMMAAVNENEDSNAKPKSVMAAAKTSTAQTGQYDEDGNELCHAWITGFFPAEAPMYAVTVLVENGGYGNDAAAPVFRKIADEIVKLKERD